MRNIYKQRLIDRERGKRESERRGRECIRGNAKHPVAGILSFHRNCKKKII